MGCGALFSCRVSQISLLVADGSVWNSMYVSENIPSVGIPKINLTTSIIQAPGKHILQMFFSTQLSLVWGIKLTEIHGKLVFQAAVDTLWSYDKIFISLRIYLLEKLTNVPWKSIVGSAVFPIEGRPLFRGHSLVLRGVSRWCFKWGRCPIWGTYFAKGLKPPPGG